MNMNFAIISFFTKLSLVSHKKKEPLSENRTHNNGILVQLSSH